MTFHLSVDVSVIGRLLLSATASNASSTGRIFLLFPPFPLSSNPNVHFFHPSDKRKREAKDQKKKRSLSSYLLLSS
ncbi:unnamed protein product [Musa acuminata subsp. malaccensis]|uniref:(wild Malaysian banana) hypothetical protein n=1 Tax=Musa acuminata subsp. malaccensis TaxID=214687 RepID=A0A804IL50_MUSAM|nr:unnamed protein product [Musa acuminata subsp. malaccensis]